MLHKTSSYTDDEIAGFRAAADGADVDMLEMLWLPADDPVRLFRSAAHPPLRGTLLSVDDQRHILYTRGSVPFYRVVPGPYRWRCSPPLPCWSSLPVAATHTRSSPQWSLDEMMRAVRQAGRPAAGMNKASPPPGASGTAKNRPTGIRGIRQSGEQSDAE